MTLSVPSQLELEVRGLIKLLASWKTIYRIIETRLFSGTKLHFIAFIDFIRINSTIKSQNLSENRNMKEYISRYYLDEYSPKTNNAGKNY